MKYMLMFAAMCIWQLPPLRALADDAVDRAQFAAAISRVHRGDSESSVAHLLGKPDDIVDPNDAANTSGRTHFPRMHCWCYGTSGHGTFATLGCVCFDANDRVWHVTGNEGTPPSRDLIDECALRELLALVDRIGGVDGRSYNPINMIQCVNRFRSESKECALAVIEEHARVASPSLSDTNPNGLLLLLQTLFEMPDELGYMPRMRIGRTIPQLPESKEMFRLFPQYPILLVDDVPVLLISDYTCFGPVDRCLKQHLEYFHAKGVLRKTALRPPDNPLTVLATFRSSKAWKVYTGLEHSDERMVAGQLLRMLSDVPNTEKIRSTKLDDGNVLGDTWNELTRDVSSLGLRWDDQGNSYRRESGAN